MLRRLGKLLKKKIVSLFILFFLVFSVNLKAKCFANPSQQLINITHLCYSCMLPLRIAGITILQGNMPDPMGSVGSPICICPAPPPIYIRIGIPVSFFEPSRMIDVVKDPYCMVGLGLNMNIPSLHKGSEASDLEDKRHTFFQAHYLIYPVYSVLEIMTDFICLEHTGVDVGYLTELDPLWQDDILTALIQPEALLFANPITNMACISDAISSQVYMPLDPLFWCKGSWGNAYPMTGNVNSGDYVQASASVAGSLIYKLHRQLILWGSWGQAGLCGYYPAPIWRKSAYRLQLLAPVPHPMGIVIGETGLKWDFAKNPPFKGDNFTYFLFKKRECCAF